ncbi:MAG: hypothetical protein JKY61_05530 [Planctomycetes bacterium]|nr:hypothetical protein [Planctomycetota bacterium]
MVELTDTAMDAIRAQLHFIAVEPRQPPSAEIWLAMVWDTNQEKARAADMQTRRRLHANC